VKKFLSESWLVLLLAVVYALLLAGAQAAFGPKIEQNKRAELEQAAREVVPDAQVETLEEHPVTVDGETRTVFKCVGAEGAVVGWALVDSDFGFQDKIKLVVGLSADGNRITGLKVVENVETPGLGNKIADEAWSSPDVAWSAQYRGLDATRPITVVKQSARKDNNEIQAVTGATISSTAVTKIANRAVEALRPKLDELR
jgi:electron transport complex protein RnfG